jgi:Alpha/beta hydrolase domain containing 18
MQRGSKLLCVSDLLLLGKATIDESRGLLHWLEAEAGFSKTGICGLSMGKKLYIFSVVKFLVTEIVSNLDLMLIF